MSYFGPNAVVDDDKTRVYDYKEDRAESESSSSVSAPGQSAFAGQQMPRMTPNVPSQPSADMWKNASSASPQDSEQRLRAQQNMWMPQVGGVPPPPPQAGGAPPMMPPGFMPPPEMVMMMSQNGMPPMPPNGMPPNGIPTNGMPPNSMPPNGMVPNGMPMNGMPPMGQMPAPPSSAGMPGSMPPNGMMPPPQPGAPNQMPPFGAAASPFWNAQGENNSGQQTPQPPTPGQQAGQAQVPPVWGQQPPQAQAQAQQVAAYASSVASPSPSVPPPSVSTPQPPAPQVPPTANIEQTPTNLATPTAQPQKPEAAKPKSAKGKAGRGAESDASRAKPPNAENVRPKPADRKDKAKPKPASKRSSRSAEPEDAKPESSRPAAAGSAPRPASAASSLREPREKSPQQAESAAPSEDPYSSTPKTKVPARSISENQQSGGGNSPRIGNNRPSSAGYAQNHGNEHRNHGSEHRNGNNNGYEHRNSGYEHRNSGYEHRNNGYEHRNGNNGRNSGYNKFHGNNRHQNNEQYYFESESSRPNRRFRHMMSDNDKRHVMEKCVKSMANDDPFVDDFYFHVYSKVHGRDVNPREAAKYYKFYDKGDGSASEKMRQQVQRAVERAQENRQRRKSSAQQAEGGDSGDSEAQQQPRHVHHAAHGSTRPRQALPASFGAGARRSGSASGSGSGGSGSHGGNGGASILSSTLGSADAEPSTLVSTESVLRNIENVYDNIMALEEHAQRRPDPTDPNAAEWAAEGPPLQEKSWLSFAVQKPEDKQGKQPFMEMSTVRKGMKAFARSWSHLDPTRRSTVLTRFVVNIQDSDAVTHSKSKFESFGQTVVQPLVHSIGTADMSTVSSMADLARSKAQKLAASRVGQSSSTAIISRAEMSSQESAAGVSEAGDSSKTVDEAEQWTEAFSSSFDDISPALGSLDVRDDSTWHFSAASASGSDLDRQSELVDLVRKQIFAQHNAAKSAGGEVGERKIAALNSFLNVSGSNATMEDITEL